MKARLFTSRVLDNKNLNEKFYLLTLQLVGEAFTFQEGQFINLKVGKGIFRSYSIFSHSGQLPNWQMFVDIAPGGPGTTYIRKLKTGDTIETTAPMGSFVLDEESGEYIMAATGCGLAPLRPMIEQLIRQEKNKILFLWGLRSQKDIAMLDLLGDWQKNKNFSYKIILSQPENGWKGSVGHINKYLIESLRLTRYKNANMYLAGNGSFVAETLKELETINYPADKINFEQCYFTPF